MSDDVLEQEAPAQVADAPEAKADDLETVARDLGWKPQAEWKGDPPPGGFATAAEFIRSQRDRAKSVEKEMKKLKTDTDKRIKRMEEQSAKQREKEIADLHKEYDWYIREAIKKGDDATEKKLIKERDEQLAKAREADEDADEDDAPSLDEDEFVEKFEPYWPQVQKRFYSEGHAWILDDDADPDAMRVMLDYVDSGIPFADALEKADKALRKAYPDRYEDEEMDEEPEEKPVRKRVPVLAPGGRGAGGGVSAASRLSPAQREIGARFVKEGLFGSLEEYAEQRIKLES